MIGKLPEEFLLIGLLSFEKNFLLLNIFLSFQQKHVLLLFLLVKEALSQTYLLGRGNKGEDFYFHIFFLILWQC